MKFAGKLSGDGAYDCHDPAGLTADGQHSGEARVKQRGGRRCKASWGKDVKSLRQKDRKVFSYFLLYLF